MGVNGIKIAFIENLKISLDGMISFIELRIKSNQKNRATWEEMLPHSKLILREFFFMDDTGCSSLRLPKSDDGVARLVNSGVIRKIQEASVPDYAEFVIEKEFRDFLKRSLYNLGRNDYPSSIPPDHPSWVTTRVSREDDPFRWAANFLKFVELVQSLSCPYSYRPSFCSSKEFLYENGDYLEHTKSLAIKIIDGRRA